jgi:hypothetical protein
VAALTAELPRWTDRGTAMLKRWMRDITLAVQTRSGIGAAVMVWAVVVAVAALTAFVFLCAAGFAWLALFYGPVLAALIMASTFLLVTAIGAIVCTLTRRRIRQRAILERAARAHATPWLLDPKIVATAVQVGRTVGWQRIVPIALLGFMAAQWAREYREHHRGPGQPLR